MTERGSDIRTDESAYVEEEETVDTTKQFEKKNRIFQGKYLANNLIQILTTKSPWATRLPVPSIFGIVQPEVKSVDNIEMVTMGQPDNPIQKQKKYPLLKKILGNYRNENEKQRFSNPLIRRSIEEYHTEGLSNNYGYLSKNKILQSLITP
ncbi:hypothetical protein CHS0354_018876 [Potamilus streckersoni]|uniref:Uncharacterized protein n=1 Tax=Potamilus streckersoni TaxID=2493646 RepID=A0AAE0VU80_9BIVA|nr:hypothetical protein CHS0354_018876 [Potamilus streckersoni]